MAIICQSIENVGKKRNPQLRCINLLSVFPNFQFINLPPIFLVLVDENHDYMVFAHDWENLLENTH